ncbi:type II toxin-antitoxin system RelE/ParE family toxin [Fodinisporobacter ferrooxydans]|uniref:Type II toxin-antitoxin system RelE/ParE family toxin n=1 Tax=Fodinisporobacter ferrooxydans TaxID=2901836 RepID=A0ABY4CE25_9BACL|nr:type II toxin-antitoxin system RelE/ParE family toxin [Alicyclobacillaceae bacterium MYW30-H2]
MSRIQFTARAEKDIARLRENRGKALKAILALETDPYIGHTLSGSLRGVRSLEFSLPGGAYRAAYVVLENQEVCLIFIVGPHENFYDEAERRYRALQKSDKL